MKRLLQYMYSGTDCKIDARKKTLLFWTGVIALCANGYAFVNYMPTHDAINHMFAMAGEWEVQLGRFLQPYYAHLRGNVVSPWLVGMIGTVFAVMSVFIITDIIKINNPVCEILACGFLVSNLAVTELCGIYIYIYDCCMIALFFACLAVWCFLHIRNPWNMIAGAVCLVVSMGFYQAYLSVTIVLCVIVLLQKTFADTSWKEEVRSASAMVLMAVMGCAGYLLLYKILLMRWHTTPTGGANGMGRLAALSVQAVLHNIMKTYKDILQFFITDSRYFGGAACALHGLLLLLALTGFAVLLFQSKLQIHNVAAAILLFITLPVWCNFISIIQGENIVLRSSYALYLLFPVCFMIAGECKRIPVRKLMQYITAFICLFLLVRNIQYSNTVYMYARVTYDRTVSIMTRVLDDIEEQEGYASGVTPVAVIGEFSRNDHVEAWHGDYKIVNGHSKASTTYPQTTYNFWRSLGSPVNGIMEKDVLKTYAESDQVQQMPCYPYEGYCRMIDDVLVVKIADRQ